MGLRKGGQQEPLGVTLDKKHAFSEDHLTASNVKIALEVVDNSRREFELGRRYALATPAITCPAQQDK